jgi:hypothetical protein
MAGYNCGAACVAACTSCAGTCDGTSTNIYSNSNSADFGDCSYTNSNKARFDGASFRRGLMWAAWFIGIFVDIFLRNNGFFERLWELIVKTFN